jgi:photosystem II stability/assembly factor-like uncharacterized protein
VTRKTTAHPAIAAVAVIASLTATQSVSAAESTLEALAAQTHFHGLAVNPGDPSQLLLATHHGFHVVSPDGTTRSISEEKHDFMGFTPHPTDPSTLFASGHPQSGGNLGFIESNDGGKSWTQVSQGAGGPVDFHSMDVSPADPNVIYGTYGGIQVSRDGGHTWEIVGPGPERLIDLAASTKDAETVYAATESGLQISMDGGKSWQAIKLADAPVSMVEVTADGRVFAFVVGTGLMQGREGSPKWDAINEVFGDRIVLHLAADPTDANRLYAIVHPVGILASQDGGRSWQPFGSR